MPTPLELLLDPMALAMLSMFAVLALAERVFPGRPLLPPAAATATILAVTFLGIFQHANLRTPHWLGYIVQRPESHTVHHARGIHAKNYADLPLVDMLFGTFENPRRFEHATGFWHGASARVLDMLIARDVSRPASPRA